VTSVLIVDDHPPFRVSVRRLLEAEGFAVVGEASDGRGALVAAEQLHPDVVLLDISLPDIDGFEVAARLTAAGSPPVIVLTSSRAASEYGSMVAETPARAFIPKAELSGPALAGLLSA
jgi:DNA-binding NarL/FixJ family response regulator